MKQLFTELTKLTVTSILVVSLYACGGAEERKIKYLEKGKAYLAEKNYKKAKVEIKNVLQIDPKFAEAYFLLGKVEESKMELIKAIGNYQKAIELNPELNQAKINTARIYVIAGTDHTIKEAMRLLDEVKKTEPENIEASLIAATLEYKVGSKEKATKSLELIVDKDITLVDGALLLANIYIKNKQYDKAKSLLIKSSENNPKDIKIRMRLAELYANGLKDAVSSERVLKELVEIDPENFTLTVALSGFYARTDQIDKAEVILKNAIKQDDDDVRRYLMLIELLASRKGTNIAERELLKAIDSKPELYSLRFSLIKFYNSIGRASEAKAVLKQIIGEKGFDVEGTKARNELARILLNEGDKLGASVYLKEVITEYPSNNDALLLSGKISLANQDPVSAINGLRTVVKNNPKNSEAALLLAKAHEINAESSLAEEVLKRSIESNPVNDITHANYARYLVSKGRIDEAVNVVDKAMVYFKESYDLLSIKLKIAGSQGKKLEVQSILDLMEVADSSKADVNLIKGKIQLSKGNMDKAIEEFEKAFEKSVDKFKPLELIVKTYVYNKQNNKALTRLQKQLEINPNDAVSNQLLGQVYLSQNKVNDARAKFKIAIQDSSSWMVPYSSLASTYISEKDFEKAVEVYQNAITKMLNKSTAQIQLAGLYELQKDFVKAMEIYKQILVDNPTNKLAANNYASLLLDHGNQSDYVKALDLSESFEKNQQSALQDTLAWAYAKTGKNAKAVEILKPIVEKSPKIAVFRYHLGYALYHMGDKAAAKSHLEIAASSEQEFVGRDEATKLLKSI
ncbi:MAG: hypothetical protein DIZ80_12940 [endosymbiont of Galathealinum brachiosum]|uniref:Cytochrome c-type biogenesis protein H TPR domain-containing protein n=1 Tax=endosymbiont of Galathealinum brachiosum TaxID=2200906 RepID=A0A370D7V8_9GAMM|nr:MAG: hypothetical protein DIZ80_12940 [endosymbiont of Galathealinum brachiosum]